MIQVRELSKVFSQAGRTAPTGVETISFEAHAGEVFGLQGPTGAGKTTTMRLLATILPPTSGTATINGYDLIRNPLEVRRSIGFLSGDMGLYHRLTPREILTHCGKLYGIPSPQLRDRIAGLFDVFGITEYADARTDKFSTGMRQKVAIARTVVHDPPVIILDEPTSGLDVPAAHMVEQFIRQARDEGKCIIYSTHIMEEAEYLCDRIAVVHQGRIQALGTIDQLRQLSGKRQLREIFLALLGITAPGRASAAGAGS